MRDSLLGFRIASARICWSRTQKDDNVLRGRFIAVHFRENALAACTAGLKQTLVDGDEASYREAPLRLISAQVKGVARPRIVERALIGVLRAVIAVDGEVLIGFKMRGAGTALKLEVEPVTVSARCLAVTPARGGDGAAQCDLAPGVQKMKTSPENAMTYEEAEYRSDVGHHGRR